MGTAMNDAVFEHYKTRVYDKIREIDHDIIPASWWDTVIRYYYDHGFSEERTVQTILETKKT